MATPLVFQTTNNFCFSLTDGKLVLIPDLSGTTPLYQGQIAVWDSTLNSGNGGIRPAATQADMADFVGIAEQNSILNSLGDQEPTVRVGFQGVYFMNTTAAEVYKFGTKVFFNETVAQVVGAYGQITLGNNAGARTVPVGYVILPNQSMLAGITTITGAAGVTVPVAIVTNWPAAGLA